jgi:hypothetical protein
MLTQPLLKRILLTRRLFVRIPLHLHSTILAPEETSSSSTTSYHILFFNNVSLKIAQTYLEVITLFYPFIPQSSLGSRLTIPQCSNGRIPLGQRALSTQELLRSDIACCILQTGSAVILRLPNFSYASYLMVATLYAHSRLLAKLRVALFFPVCYVLDAMLAHVRQYSESK